MCGILGFISKHSTPVDVDIGESLARIAHRGPDGRGVFRAKQESYQLYLGHTRLAIIDLEERAAQPMSFKGCYTLVFNGEIYNYRELREELRALGYCFETEGDAEVVLAAYAEWGEACVERFNGMWALAIYDSYTHHLFCSRDRFGVKPFYYYEDEERFIFASEIKALLPFIGQARANMRAMIPYIARGFLDGGTETFFSGIYRLAASQNLIYDLVCHQKRFATYYAIPRWEATSTSPAELLELLRDSIRLRLRSDVRVGACLSGGLDSSGVVALASEMQDSRERLIAIHAKSSLKESDESAYARAVAEHLGLELHIIEPSFEEFVGNLDEVFYTQEEPFGGTSIFMQFLVMKKARELGCKVMLDGQGADEVFLGYEHYLKYILKDLRDRGVCTTEEFFSDLKLFQYNQGMILEELVAIDDVEVALNIIETKGNLNPLHFDKGALRRLLEYPRDHFLFQCREIFSNNLPALLRCEDRDSMHFGIEARLPYLDYRVVEAVVNLPSEVKFQRGYLKFALREALEACGGGRLLPREIVWRYNKMGFESPQALWIERYRQKMMEVIEESTILKELFTRLDIRRDDFLWKLFSIAKWEQIFDVKV